MRKRMSLSSTPIRTLLQVKSLLTRMIAHHIFTVSIFNFSALTANTFATCIPQIKFGY
jgi:hypothetical protein